MAKISFIGSGRTATALGKALYYKGHTFHQVWSRTEASAAILAAQLDCAYTNSLADIDTEADLYIVAVKDGAIEDIANQLQVQEKMIAHTSGIKSKDMLKGAGNNYGIFYPFVSMSKEAVVDFRSVTVMIEGSNQDTIDQLQSVAQSISDNVMAVAEAQRQSLHLAAVFANNFTNHMYVIAEELLKDKGMDFDILRPLIASHFTNILKTSPSHLQTGPAIRHDSSTIAKHLELLDQDIEWRRLYITMTQAIQDWHTDK